MDNIKQAIKELDFFEHPSLLRYQTQPGYRTLTGGIISVVIIIIFAILFADKVIGTLTNMDPSGQINNSFDTDPSSFDLKANSEQSNFMFAVGIDNLDLNIQKYFEFKLQNYAYVGESQSKTTIPLQKCDISQWSGTNDEITASYKLINFDKWLCPATNSVFTLQGKFISNIFKYSRILVKKCDSTTSVCASQSQITAFINSYPQGVPVNFYYINPIINSGDINYLKYYVQDSNYFTFSASTGVTANIYFSEYKITTDHSIFPWKDTTEDDGAIKVDPTNSQKYTLTNTQYAKIFLRKSSTSIEINRKFAKIDQTLAFMGGLLGFFLLILTFMKVYNKFCYQIEFGDRVFKQNSNGTFGSQHFNFIVFLGYGLYNILTMFGVHLKWFTMRKYHECRVECLKQLDVHLLFKKIEFFEEVANIVLEDHHIKGIFMLPKKKIEQIQQSRRKFLLQSLLYHQLDRKARQVNIEQNQYRKRYDQFLKKENSLQYPNTGQQQKQEEIKRLQKQFSRSFKKLQLEKSEGDKYSKKIFDKMGMKEVLNTIINRFTIKQNNADLQLNSIQNLNKDQAQNDLNSRQKIEKSQKNGQVNSKSK